VDQKAERDQRQIWESYRKDLKVFDLEARVFVGMARKPERAQGNIIDILEVDTSPYNTILGNYCRNDFSYWEEDGQIEEIALKVRDDGLKLFLGEIDEAYRIASNGGYWITIETNDLEFVKAHQKIKWKEYPNYAALMQQAAIAAPAKS